MEYASQIWRACQYCGQPVRRYPPAVRTTISLQGALFADMEYTYCRHCGGVNGWRHGEQMDSQAGELWPLPPATPGSQG